MAEQGQRRKLAAVLSADVVGYSRLMQADEQATVETLKKYRAAIGRVIERHQGRIVNAPGDNILAEFASAVEAVQAAVEIQKVLEGRNLELAPARRMLVRIGINLGDVIEEADGTIYGDGVNIAARMEALAEGGGICISSTVYDAVEGKLDYGFDFLGEQPVKNIARPVRVYRVRGEGRPQAAPAPRAWRRRQLAVAAAGVLLVALAGLGLRLYRADSPTPATPGEAESLLPLPDKPSIAVLPFDNLSRDPDQEYFADGLTEDIITGLSRFRELFVIARHSTFKYKGQAVEPREVARELGVRYLLEGSVRRSGDRVRVAVQLLDATSSGHLWAETYDRELTELFAIQDDLTRQITGALGFELREAELAKAARKAPTNWNTYDLVLRTYGAHYTLEHEDFAEAIPLLTKAIDLDPGYAHARAYLALMLTVAYEYGWFDLDPDPLGRAEAEATRALQDDPSDALAHQVLARCHYYRGRFDLFEQEADAALALNPNDAFALAWLGLTFAMTLGRIDEGAEMARRAIRLNPHYPGWFTFALFLEHYFSGRYADALAETIKMNYPDVFWYQELLAVTYAQLGELERARAARDRLLELKPDYTFAWTNSVYPYHESLLPRYFEGVRKAGLPLGDLDALRKAGLDIPDAPQTE